MANRNPAGVWHNPDWLTEQRAQGKTTRQMAAAAGCSRCTIDAQLHHIGLLPDRERKEPPQYIAPVVDDEPEPEPEPPIVDCLDCPIERTSCAGCAAVYEMQGERWIR